MSSFALLQPFFESTILVDFRCGTLDPICVSLGKSQTLFQGRIYRPEPGLKVTLPKQGGGLSEEPCKMVLPADRPEVHPALHAFAALISSLRPFARTVVRVIELARTSESDTKTLFLYEGVITKVFRNPSGRTKVVEIELQTELHEGLTDIALGRRCDPQCDLVFGSNGCGVNNKLMFDNSTYYPNHLRQVRNASVIMTVNASDPRLVTVAMNPVVHGAADLRTITAQPRGWWDAAYFLKDGLRMRVHSWAFDTSLDVGTNTFVLNQSAPASWNGAVAELRLDCARTREACADRGNIGRFSGLGYGIPAYNPTLEVAGG